VEKGFSGKQGMNGAFLSKRSRLLQLKEFLFWGLALLGVRYWLTAAGTADHPIWLTPGG